MLFCFLVHYRSRDKSFTHKLIHNATICIVGFMGTLISAVYIKNDQTLFEKFMYCLSDAVFFITAWLTLVFFLKRNNYSKLSKNYIFFLFISIFSGAVISALFFGLYYSTKESSEFSFMVSRKWFSEELSSGVLFVFLFMKIIKSINKKITIKKLLKRRKINTQPIIIFSFIIFLCVTSLSITLSVLSILPLIYLCLFYSFEKIVIICSATGIALNYVYIKRLLSINEKIDKEYFFELHYLFQTNTSVIIMTVLIASFFINRNKKNIRRIEIISNYDTLTGILNRRSLNKKIINITKSIRTGDQEMMSIFILDIDHFKSINDTYGHTVGDNVIKKIAKTLKKYIRPQDLLCRWGGEEFLIIIQGLSVNECLDIAERIRSIIESSSLKISDSQSVRFTTSIGVSFFHLEKIEDFNEAFKEADKMLYNAKEQGRNRVNYSADINPVRKLIP